MYLRMSIDRFLDIHNSFLDIQTISKNRFMDILKYIFRYPKIELWISNIQLIFGYPKIDLWISKNRGVF